MNQLKTDVTRHFEIMDEIQRLKQNDEDIRRRIVTELVEQGMSPEFFTINWKRLHSLVFGHPGKSDKRR